MGRMIRRFDVKGKKITQEAVLSTEDPELIYEIIRGIFYGIKNNLSDVDLFEIQNNEDYQVFSIPKNKWKKALEKCLSKMIEIEDYETCALIQTEIKGLV